MRISQNRSDFGFVRCAKAARGSRTNKLLMSCEPGLPNHRRRSHFSAMEISCCQPCVRATDQKQTTEQEPCFRQTKMQDDASRQGVVKSIRPRFTVSCATSVSPGGSGEQSKKSKQEDGPPTTQIFNEIVWQSKVSQRGPFSEKTMQGKLVATASSGQETCSGSRRTDINSL
jgi:hypothetical protein